MFEFKNKKFISSVQKYGSLDCEPQTWKDINFFQPFWNNN